MHEIEPFYRWRDDYIAAEDERSPFYQTEYSEFEYSKLIYNYYIHPQWDEFGSRTLYLKILFVDYELNYTVIEFIGEWNDAVENDIMQLKRDIIDHLNGKGITKYILIAENILNFHNSDLEYYEEWNEDIKEEGGWVVMLNTPAHTESEMKQAHLQQFVHFMEIDNWRTFQPGDFFQVIDNKMLRIG